MAAIVQRERERERLRASDSRSKLVSNLPLQHPSIPSQYSNRGKIGNHG
uniref:Uncharacterized protein n=1 Tax=Nelumbo nucifera TaxID=4432 RepID=A0A822YHC8_NELNU|nr:TPA_asm: hypothetical protein HUJ06_010702 [Nelumbo nucifera]